MFFVCDNVRVVGKGMEAGEIPKTTEHFIENQNSMDIDEEEEYLKALNASLLIQTPLQV